MRRRDRSSRIRSRSWCFTFNNPGDTDIERILAFFTSTRASYVFQEERGDEKETPHLQGFVRWVNAREFAAVKSGIGGNPHIEKCKHPKEAITYCSDPGKRHGGIWNSPDIVIRRVEVPVINQRWQRLLDEYISTVEPDPRLINWVVDQVGGAGKTNMCKYLRAKYGGIYITGGKGPDIKYAVSEFIKSNGNPAIILFDFPRSTEGHISYQSIEEIRNGILFSTKYESTDVSFPPCHMFCFSNFYPDESKLSADRWNIIDLAEEVIVIPDDDEKIPRFTLAE